MKKLLLLFMISFTLLTSVKAQLFVGGSVFIYEAPQNSSLKYTNISVAPVLGYQYQRWSFGLGFYYQKVSGIYHNLTFGSANAFSYEPFVQYDIVKKERWAFFTDLTLSYTRNGDNRYHYFGFSPGVRFNLTKHLMTDIYLGTIGYSDDYFYGYKGFICSISLNTAQISLYYKLAK